MAARFASTSRGNNEGPLYEELWLACAGSIASLPRTGDRVIYYPQGHMEQVSAQINSGTDQSMPLPNLEPQIHCQVMGIQLSAEVDTDEVYAQFSLIPEPEVVVNLLPPSDDKEEFLAPPKASQVHMFSKPLTASDTSTHGGFSIHRKAAEDCFPPLNMNLNPPSQELVAKDLHGNEWRFRHIYRGQPKRHLLTTGWSAFVSQKKLVAGDVVIFLRGEDGELRVGIRRATRPLTSQPQIVLSNNCMHMGLVAAAAHAVNTRTPFCVFYKPRASPEFIIPVNKYRKSMKSNLTIGLRFCMKLEAGNIQERSYNGTVTGIEDLDAARWKSSKWRCLEVEWDEQTINDRPNRVSPWEIELLTNTSNAPLANPPPLGLRNKRARGGNIPSSCIPEMSDLGRCKPAYKPLLLPSRLPRVLQGQEYNSPFGGGSVPHNDIAGKNNGKSQVWSAKAVGGGCDIIDSMGSSGKADKWIPANNDNYLPELLFHGFRGGLPEPKGYRFTHGMKQLNENTLGTTEATLNSPDHRFASHNRVSPAWLSFDTSWQLTSSLQRSHTTNNTNEWINILANTATMPSQSPCESNISSIKGEPALLKPPPTITTHLVASKNHSEKKSAVSPLAHSEGGCKIFGFSLGDVPPPAPALLPKSRMGMQQLEREEEVVLPCDVPPSITPLGRSESVLQASKVVRSDESSASSEQEKLSQKSSIEYPFSSRKSTTVRSCTKVIMKGNMLGRGIDLSRIDGYDMLLDELERMFCIEGDLKNSAKGWQIAYCDNEGDMLLVGDDPWLEFCAIARKIYILSPEEVISGLGAKLSGSYNEENTLKDSANCYN